jgi:hypothetical protein
MMLLPRAPVPEIKVSSIPDGPGVYAWSKSADPVYAEDPAIPSTSSTTDVELTPTPSR